MLSVRVPEMQLFPVLGAISIFPVVADGCIHLPTLFSTYGGLPCSVSSVGGFTNEVLMKELGVT